MLVVGREKASEEGWFKTEHVVLTPAEVEALVIELGVQRLSENEKLLLAEALAARAR